MLVKSWVWMVFVDSEANTHTGRCVQTHVSTFCFTPHFPVTEEKSSGSRISVPERTNPHFNPLRTELHLVIIEAMLLRHQVTWLITI